MVGRGSNVAAQALQRVDDEVLGRGVVCGNEDAVRRAMSADVRRAPRGSQVEVAFFGGGLRDVLGQTEGIVD
eukprot:4172512-Pyramimonas_sp.AAC.1